MAWWASNKVEPKRAYRWIAYINMYSAGGSDFGPKPHLVQSFTKPTFTLDSEKIINNFTSETIIATKNYVWNDISITMIDTEDPTFNTSNSFYKWLTGLGYQPVQSAEGMSTLFTNIQNDRLVITLHQINADGDKIDGWDFIKPQPTTIDFGGELSYDSDDSVKVTMGITYVAAKYKKF